MLFGGQIGYGRGESRMSLLAFRQAEMKQGIDSRLPRLPAENSQSPIQHLAHEKSSYSCDSQTKSKPAIPAALSWTRETIDHGAVKASVQTPLKKTFSFLEGFIPDSLERLRKWLVASWTVASRWPSDRNPVGS